MRLAQLTHGLPAQIHTPGGGGTSLGPFVRHVVEDSRCARPGSLFVCRAPLSRTPLYARDAARRGACAVVTPHPLETITIPHVLGDPQSLLTLLLGRFHKTTLERVKVVGITGTDGKTTTTHMVAAMMSAAGRKTGTIGTLGMDAPGYHGPNSLTTPAPADTAHALESFSHRGVGWAVMECSSHGLDQGRLGPVRPIAAALTGLTRDHLDYHGSLENYFLAKANLFLGLTAGSLAVAKDATGWTNRLQEMRPDLHWITWGKGGNLDAELTEDSLKGISLLVHFPDGSTAPLTTRLVGSFQRENILTALALAEGLGIPREASLTALSSLRPIKGRMDSITTDLPFNLIVDYAHTPDALENSIASLLPLTEGQLTVVVGCGGDRDKGKRPLMARAALQAHRAILTSDNPRNEEPQEIIDEMVEGLLPEARERMEAIPDRPTAIRRAIERASPGDTILLAGKGHESVQIIGSTHHRQSDYGIARQTIQEISTKCA
ncbi:UDP-N-acetylmuramoyl-L-alanyl-D-glutamate--2,6-diaminopimelate ligase [bacterium]|nr:UDP-N-acetylmuramoyl-L-alanyl-D-glutamate--2,6-diaminopimelate ligase [bacterium]